MQWKKHISPLSTTMMGWDVERRPNGQKRDHNLAGLVKRNEISKRKQKLPPPPFKRTDATPVGRMKNRLAKKKKSIVQIRKLLRCIIFYWYFWPVRKVLKAIWLRDPEIFHHFKRALSIGEETCFCNVYCWLILQLMRNKKI